MANRIQSISTPFPYLWFAFCRGAGTKPKTGEAFCDGGQTFGSPPCVGHLRFEMSARFSFRTRLAVWNRGRAEREGKEVKDRLHRSPISPTKEEARIVHVCMQAKQRSLNRPATTTPTGHHPFEKDYPRYYPNATET